MNAPQPASTPTEIAQRGSQVVAALEDLWSAVRRHHPELPSVVMVTGSANAKWGHTDLDRWDLAAESIGSGGQVRAALSGSVSEMLIAGERLACGATLTAETMLHEGAHVLAHLRGLKDTCRQNRYHNKTFVRLATELGMQWPKDQVPSSTIGYSEVRLRPETIERYRPEIDALGAAIRLYVPLHPLLAEYLRLPTVLGGDAGVGGASEPFAPAGKDIAADDEGGDGLVALLGKRPPRRLGPPKSRNLSVATCACPAPRKLRIAPRTLELAPVICGACEQEFEYRSED